MWLPGWVGSLALGLLPLQEASCWVVSSSTQRTLGQGPENRGLSPTATQVNFKVDARAPAKPSEDCSLMVKSDRQPPS